MISSKNINFMFFLLTFLGSMMSVYGDLTKCEENIIKDFGYIEQYPSKIRYEMPRRAFLSKTIDSFTNEDAKQYFEHLHTFLHHKDSMLLPNDYCDNTIKSLIFDDNAARELEYLECVSLLIVTFFDSQDKADVIKTIFWNFTEGMFSEFGTEDYRYKYFYYLCGKIFYHQNTDQKFPMTTKEFCATIHLDIGINLSYKMENTKENDTHFCASQILNEFGITSTWKQKKARSFAPLAAFRGYVLNDLESVDATDYYYHISHVIKAKAGTENPRQYCNTITEAYKILGDDKRIEEERKCVTYLLSMYLDSDATTVLKYAFMNFKEFHFSKLSENDYRFKYFYYLTGSFDFYQISFLNYTPLTPWEFCSVDRIEALNLGITMEPGSISGEGTSS